MVQIKIDQSDKKGENNLSLKVINWYRFSINSFSINGLSIKSSESIVSDWKILIDQYEKSKFNDKFTIHYEVSRYLKKVWDMLSWNSILKVKLKSTIYEINEIEKGKQLKLKVGDKAYGDKSWEIFKPSPISHIYFNYPAAHSIVLSSLKRERLLSLEKDCQISIHVLIIDKYPKKDDKMCYYHQTYNLAKYQVKALFKHINRKHIKTFKCE